MSTDVQDALSEVQAAQTAYWHALYVLEGLTGLDLDSTRDFEGVKSEDLAQCCHDPAPSLRVDSPEPEGYFKCANCEHACEDHNRDGRADACDLCDCPHYVIDSAHTEPETCERCTSPAVTPGCAGCDPNYTGV